MSDSPFTEAGLTFALDREGVSIEGKTREIAGEIDLDALGIADEDDLVDELLGRFSALVGEDLEDPEGMIELSVQDASGRIVGAVVIAPSEGDDAIEVSGECDTSISSKDVIAALTAALVSVSPES